MRKNIILLTALLREQQFLSCDMIPNSDIICTNDLSNRMSGTTYIIRNKYNAE